MTYSKEVKADYERAKTLYKTYFKYERYNAKYDIVPLVITLIIAAVVLYFGLVNINFSLIIFSLCLFLTSFIYRMHHILRYYWNVKRFNKAIKTQHSSFDSFIFTFDSDAMVYKLETEERKVYWTKITDIIENKRDLYLFEANKELHTIISNKILGDDLYDTFLAIAKSKFE